MRPELQKMLSHCGMAENIGSQTTLVCSNQQCSGPLYKGVRQSVSKKAGPPTETGSANKWLEVKKKKKKEGRQLQAYATGRTTVFFLPFANYLLSFMWNNSSGALPWPPGAPRYTGVLIWLHSYPLYTLPIPLLGNPLRAAPGTLCLIVSPFHLRLSSEVIQSILITSHWVPALILVSSETLDKLFLLYFFFPH